MARKVKTITITAGSKDTNRDYGKVFVIAEMCASDAEDWAGRALEAIAQKTDIPAGLSNAGMLGVFIMGLKPILSAPWGMVKPLLDEMFDKCLSIQPGKDTSILRGAGTELIRPAGLLIEVDIEEVATRVFLRDKIFELHTGFSLAANLSQMWAEVQSIGRAAALLQVQISAGISTQSSPGTQV